MAFAPVVQWSMESGDSEDWNISRCFWSSHRVEWKKHTRSRERVWIINEASYADEKEQMVMPRSDNKWTLELTEQKAKERWMNGWSQCKPCSSVSCKSVILCVCALKMSSSPPDGLLRVCLCILFVWWRWRQQHKRPELRESRGSRAFIITPWHVLHVKCTSVLPLIESLGVYLFNTMSERDKNTVNPSH